MNYVLPVCNRPVTPEEAKEHQQIIEFEKHKYRREYLINKINERLCGGFRQWTNELKESEYDLVMRILVEFAKNWQVVVTLSYDRKRTIIKVTFG